MPWPDLTQEALDAVVDVDVKGTLLMTHEFGERMLEQGHGNIVNVGSTVIVRGSPRAPQSAAAKYAILGITKSYAKVLAPAVRVNTFAPGFMETERLLNRADWKSGRREVLLSQTPMGGIPPPEFVAGPCPLPRHRRGGAPRRLVHARRRRLQHGRRLSAADRTQEEEQNP